MKSSMTGKVKATPAGYEDEESSNVWQLSYLDTLTVLLCMMIILASINGAMDAPERHDEIEESTGHPRAVSWDIQELEGELERLLRDELSAGKLLLESGEYEIRMQFSGSTFFNQGEAVLLPAGRELISRIIDKLAVWYRQDFKIDIEGHTDGAPIQSWQFPSNWELSAARASGVVRYFLDLGIPSQQLKASGYADAFPLKAERDENGKYIPAHQDYNRRIVIRLYFD
jgi:chemotaxis protein MotB